MYLHASSLSFDYLYHFIEGGKEVQRSSCSKKETTSEFEPTYTSFQSSYSFCQAKRLPETFFDNRSDKKVKETMAAMND